MTERFTIIRGGSGESTDLKVYIVTCGVDHDRTTIRQVYKNMDSAHKFLEYVERQNGWTWDSFTSIKGTNGRWMKIEVFDVHG